jgi:3-phosphoshikimate 1-carboxyvinyltransferase
MAAALTALGADIEERPDGWVIRGGRPLAGGRAESRGDHRIAMASAVTALVARGETTVDDVANVATSFPTFLASLARLGGPIEQLATAG